MATSMLSRAPTMYSTQRANNHLVSMPGFDSNRSTRLIACLRKPPGAKTSPWPMVPTAKDAPVITPNVALAREETRFACKSSANSASTKL
jgi:hypothetical protein